MNFEDITINEADFFAKHSTLIEILPNFDEESLTFLSGAFGPFRPNKPVEVFIVFAKKIGQVWPIYLF